MTASFGARAMGGGRRLLHRWTAQGRRERAEVLALLERHSARRGVVVYPSAIDWGWMKQRPHHLVAEFANAGWLAFFRSPCSRTDRVDGFREVAPRLYLCRELDALHAIPAPVLLIHSPRFAPLARRFRRAVVIYDCLDDLRVHDVRGDEYGWLMQQEAWLLRRADLVLATAERIRERLRAQRPDVVLVPNAADTTLFRPEPPGTLPADLAAIRGTGRPVVGYCGALAAWVDYALLRAVAERCADSAFVLIGPDYDGSLPRSGLTSLPNVHWLGERRFEELPAYLHGFDVATIPFVIDEVTRSTSPVKLYEYLACGVPVVSTPLPECKRFPEVSIAQGAGAFAEALRESIARRGDPAFRARLVAHAQANDWRARYERIAQGLARRPAR